MSLVRSRRSFLALSGTTALAVTAGCLGWSDPATFTVYNELDRAVTVSVQFVYVDSFETVFDGGWMLDAEASQSINSPMDAAGTYRIRAVVERLYDESYDWTVAENEAPDIYLKVDSVGMELGTAPPSGTHG